MKFVAARAFEPGGQREDVFVRHACIGSYVVERDVVVWGEFDCSDDLLREDVRECQGRSVADLEEGYGVECLGQDSYGGRGLGVVGENYRV